MDERDQNAHRIFVSALELDDDARREVVARECGDDAELHRLVSGLLASLAKSTDFLESPVLTKADPAAEPTTLPEGIEGIRVIRRLGAGGMATVYEAEQQSPRRRVAVKILNGALVGTSALQRFQFEADILARLAHPDIAHIFGCGTCKDAFGREVPYFLMEYVPEATTISEYAKVHRLPTRERLELFERVCDAVQYGHQSGVIHRDLKPGNILVDGEGHPRVIDFGVAVAIGSDVERLTVSHEGGQLIGTLNYMSPEQCSGDSRVDTRSDVYSLGVVLYELMTDSRPYDLSSSSILDAVRIVQVERPVPLSTRSPSVKKELNSIAMKALEKDPERRYATASELAADVRRFLDDRPVLARPATAAYQLKMFAKRNRVLVVAVSAVLLALLAGIAATTRMAYVADAARNAAQENERVLEQVAEFQEAQLSGTDVPEMGIHFRTALVDAAQRSLRNPAPEAASTDDIDNALVEFDRVLSRVDLTTVALRVLQQSILEPAQEAINQQFHDQPVVRARLLQALAKTMAALGRREQALSVLQEALEIRRNVLGENHLETLHSQQMVGALLGTLGRPEEGLACLNSVQERLMQAVGSDHPATLSAANSLGGLLRLSGDHAGAERVWRKTLNERRRVLGDDHPDTLTSLNNLGVILALRGEYAEAEEVYRELVTRRRQMLDRNSPELASGLSNLGLLLLDRNQLDEARLLLEESLEIQRTQMGNDHPSTLYTMNSVAKLRLEQGDFDAAEQLIRENLETRRRTLGPDHPDTLRELAEMSQYLRVAGRPEDAERTIREAIDSQRRVLGDDHPDLIISVGLRALILQDMQRFDESEKLHQQTIARAQQVFGPQDASVGECMFRYGSMLLAAQRWPAAEQQLQQAYEILRATQGPNARSTCQTARFLIDLYEAMADSGTEGDRTKDIQIWRRAAAGIPPHSIPHSIPSIP